MNTEVGSCAFDYILNFSFFSFSLFAFFSHFSRYFCPRMRYFHKKNISTWNKANLNVNIFHLDVFCIRWIFHFRIPFNHNLSHWKVQKKNEFSSFLYLRRTVNKHKNVKRKAEKREHCLIKMNWISGFSILSKTKV